MTVILVLELLLVVEARRRRRRLTDRSLFAGWLFVAGWWAGTYGGVSSYAFLALVLLLWNVDVVSKRLAGWLARWRRWRRLTVDWHGFGRTRGAFGLGDADLWPYRSLTPFYDALDGHRTRTHDDDYVVTASGGGVVVAGPALTVRWQPWAEYHPPVGRLEFPTFSAPRGGITFLPAILADAVAPRQPRPRRALAAIRYLVTGRRP